MSHAEFLAKHQITQVTQSLYSPYFAPRDFWLFQKLKSPLKGKRFQTVSETQENTTGQLMAIERTVWGPKVRPSKGTEVSLSYVQCVSDLSSSINVSTLHITWLDAFWIDRVCKCAQRCSSKPRRPPPSFTWISMSPISFHPPSHFSSPFLYGTF